MVFSKFLFPVNEYSLEDFTVTGKFRNVKSRLRLLILINLIFLM